MRDERWEHYLAVPDNLFRIDLVFETTNLLLSVFLVLVVLLLLVFLLRFLRR